MRTAAPLRLPKRVGFARHKAGHNMRDLAASCFFDCDCDARGAVRRARPGLLASVAVYGLTRCLLDDGLWWRGKFCGGARKVPAKCGCCRHLRQRGRSASKRRKCVRRGRLIQHRLPL